METKTCIKCHSEKPETDFVKRADGYQKICKTCMAAYVRSHKTTPRTPKPQTKINPGASQKIVALENRIRLIASSYAADPMEADDCYGYVVEKLLTRVMADDTNSRILMMAKSRAADWRNRERAYGAYVACEQELTGGGAEEAGFDFFEWNTISSMPHDQERVVEDEIFEHEQIEKILRVIETLPKENRRVISMIILGYKQNEIAHALGVSEAAISLHMQRLRKNQAVLSLVSA
jgi:RNA polymerase sigma factor (sigma-70 family)